MPQNDAGGVEGTLPASGDRTIALRERRSGGKGDDLRGIQHTGFFTMPGAALKGEELKGPKPMQGQKAAAKRSEEEEVATGGDCKSSSNERKNEEGGSLSLSLCKG